MISIGGSYLDGHNAASRSARLEFNGVTLKLHSDLEILTIPVDALKISDRLGSTPRHISWGSREKFVTKDNDAIDALVAELGLANNSWWIANLESKNTIAVVATILAMSFAVLFAVFGVPAIARTVALEAPTAVSVQLADSTMLTLDQILEPSELDLERREKLAGYFRQHGYIDRVEFRKAKRLGANALTLSATTVVFTDELVNLTDNDEELLAVYFHELGHAELRHVEQSILQNSAWVVLFSVIVGDFSGAGELLVSLPLVVGQMAYSRELEREADQFAIDALLDAGLDPVALADILEKLSLSHAMVDADADTDESPNVDEQAESDGENWAEKVFEYLSTHPGTEERLAHIRSFSRPD